MANYDFSTLNPTDFEKLVCDLLNKQADTNIYGMYRSFKDGKDKGVDLLFSTAKNDFEFVVQIKHYVKSSFSKLKSDLIKIEKEKVKKLNPENYIFVTSLALSIQNKEDIKEIFSPYIHSLEDILGKDDLNDILRLYSDIEEKHFKLWFSSTVSLQKLLNYKFIGRLNEFNEYEIKRKLRLFVSTKELERAKLILNQNKFLIITGDPGVGKTTLSEILIYKFLSKDYELIVIYDDIKEIEQTLKNDNTKQIFYFDDFLGHTQAEINKSKSAEISLIRIISRIEKLENKYLILNTRKFILNTFLEESERMRNFHPLKSEYKIELYSYSYGAKRRMLDNHIFESELTESQIQIIKDLSFYICSHKNFSPRHLDFFTNIKHIGNFDANELNKFIVENLTYPKRIWQHAYLNQITDYERFLLNSMYSLNSDIDKDTLEKAFNNRLEFEVKNNNFVKPINSFNNCLRKLNDGFIITYNTNNIRFNFINPSLEDFIHYFIDNDHTEIDRILISAINLEQWYFFYKPYFSNKNTISDKLIQYFTSSFIRDSKETMKDAELFKSAIFLYYFDSENQITEIISILKKIKNWDFLNIETSTKIYNLKFLQDAKKNQNLNDLISNLDIMFFINSILSSELLNELIEIIQLLERHYGFNFKNIFENKYYYKKYRNNIKEIQELCQTLFQEEIDANYEYLSKNIDTDAHLDIIDKIEDDLEFINAYIFEDFQIDYINISSQNWNEIAERNYSDYLIMGKNYDLENFENYEDNEKYSYDEYYDEYDYEKEKENASLAFPKPLHYRIITEFEVNEADEDELPF
jgi:adenylate kinase